MPMTIDLTDDFVAQFEELQQKFHALSTSTPRVEPAIVRERDELRAACEEAKQDNSRLQQEISRLRADLAASKAAPCSECEGLKRDLDMLKQHNAAENRKWEERLQQETESLREQLLQAASASINVSSKHWQDDLSSAQQESQRYQEKARDSQNRVDRLRAELDEVEARGKSLQTEYDELRAESTGQAAEIQRLKKELWDRRQHEAPAHRPADVSAESKLRQDFASLDEQFKALQVEHDEKHAKNRELANEVQRLKNELRKFRHERK